MFHGTTSFDQLNQKIVSSMASHQTNFSSCGACRKTAFHLLIKFAKQLVTYGKRMNIQLDKVSRTKILQKILGKVSKTKILQKVLQNFCSTNFTEQCTSMIYCQQHLHIFVFQKVVCTNCFLFQFISIERMKKLKMGE